MADPWAAFRVAPVAAGVIPAAAAPDPWAAFRVGKEEPPGEQLKGTVGSVAQGLMLGGGDEAKAAVHAAIPGVIEAANTKLFDVPDWVPSWLKADPKAMPVSTAPTYDQRYDEELKKTRGTAEEFAKNHPGLDIGGKIAGGIAGAATALPRALVTSPGMIGRALKGAAVGGVLSGASGFNEGEGGFENRATNAMIPAAAGFGLGAAAPPILAGVGMAGKAAGRFAGDKVGDWISIGLPKEGPITPPTPPSSPVPKTAPTITPPTPPTPIRARIAAALKAPAENAPLNAAHADIAKTMEESGIEPEEALKRLRELGPSATLADINKQFGLLGQKGYTLGGKVPEVYDTNLGAEEGGRAFGEPARTIARGQQHIADDLHYRQFADKAAEARRAEAERLYGEARAAGLNVTPKLGELMAREPVKEAAATIHASDTKFGGQGAPRLQGVIDDPLVANRVKGALKRHATAAYNPASSNFGKVDPEAAGNLARDYRTELHLANPKLKIANDAYHAQKRVEELLDKGRTFMSEGVNAKADALDPIALAAELKNAPAGGEHAFLVGMQDTVRNKAGASIPSARAFNRTLPGRLNIIDRLNASAGPENTAALVKGAKTENTFQDTLNTIRGGSNTANKIANAASEFGEFGEHAETLHKAAELVMDPSLGKAGGFLKHIYSKIDPAKTEGAAKKRLEIAKLLSNHLDPGANEKTLELAAKLMGKTRRSHVGAASAIGNQGATQFTGDNNAF